MRRLFMFLAVFAAAAFSGCEAPIDALLGNLTVTYNGNGSTGGSVPEDEETYRKGDLVSVLGQGDLVKQGYSFRGWSKTPAGTGTIYAEAGTFKMGTSDIELYAIWTNVGESSSSLSVTYHGNGNTGGSVPVDSTVYSEGDQVSLLSRGDLVREGYSFAGWYTYPGEETLYSETGTFTMGKSSVGLYAKWTSDTVNPSAPRLALKIINIPPALEGVKVNIMTMIAPYPGKPDFTWCDTTAESGTLHVGEDFFYVFPDYCLDTQYSRWGIDPSLSSATLNFQINVPGVEGVAAGWGQQTVIGTYSMNADAFYPSLPGDVIDFAFNPQGTGKVTANQTIIIDCSVYETNVSSATDGRAPNIIQVPLTACTVVAE